MSKGKSQSRACEQKPSKPTPAHSVVVPQISDDPVEDRACRNRLHGPVFAGMVYASQIAGVIGPLYGGEGNDLHDATKATTCVHAMSLRNQMQPRDALEGMLIDQTLWTHARIAALSRLTVNADTLDKVKVLSEATDRATNTYRRLMLALAEYRRPPRTGDTFTAIKQANIAGQQVVQNASTENPTTKNAANEKGCSDEPATPDPPKALPTLSRGPGFIAPVDLESEAVASHARPHNS